MKKCPKCGKELQDDAMFCTNCGSNVEHVIVCPICGKSLQGESAFCIHCGTKLDAESVAAKLDELRIQKEEQEKAAEEESSRIEKEKEERRIAELNAMVEQRKIQAQKDRKQLIISIFVVLALIVLVGIGLYYVVSKKNDEKRIDPSQSQVEQEDKTVEVESETEANDDISSKEIDKKLVIYEFTKDVEGKCEPSEDALNTYIGYEPVDYEEEDYEPYLSSLNIEKGKIYENYNSGWYDVSITPESSDWSVINISGGDDLSYYIPRNSYKETSYKQGRIAASDLEDHVITFQADDGSVIKLYRIYRNRHSLYDYMENSDGEMTKVPIGNKNHQYGISWKNVDSDFTIHQFLNVKDGYICIDDALSQGCISPLNSDSWNGSCINETGTLLCDVTNEPDLIESHCAYIPELKAIMVNEHMYKFVEKRRVDKPRDEEVSESAKKTTGASSSVGNSQYSASEQRQLDLVKEYGSLKKQLESLSRQFDENYRKGFQVVSITGDIESCINRMQKIVGELKKYNSNLYGAMETDISQIQNNYNSTIRRLRGY